MTGVSIFNQKTTEFEFRPGPIFAQIVLADEINRATPRTQAALLEAMAEGRVTVDGADPHAQAAVSRYRHAEPDRSRGDVPAARSPARPLPDALHARLSQSRRRAAHARPAAARHPLDKLEPVVSADELRECQRAVPQFTWTRKFGITSRRSYMPRERITRRANGRKSRASIALYSRAQAVAGIRGRNYVEPDDVEGIVAPVVTHRLILQPEARLQNVSVEELITDILETTPVPVMENRAAAPTARTADR